jgi:CTP-dependent riboflavin kinase
VEGINGERVLLGIFYTALVMGYVLGAVTRPKVQGYPEDCIEIVAPLYLRKEYHVKEVDKVEVKIWLE